jgi:F0F1-type ATP synthase assembly protein I
MTPEQKNDRSRGYGQGYEYIGVALNFTVAILLFGAAGWVLDGWIHTRPLFAIIGAFVGGFAGFMSIYYRVKKDTAANKTAAEQGGGEKYGGEGRQRGGE